MTILHIDSSARSADSVSRKLSLQVVEKLGGDVIRRDLSNPLPQLDTDWLAANFTPDADRSDAHREALALSDTLIDEIKRADTIVIGAPIYNFSVPASLKSWIDLVARAGVTFNYTPDGPVGLLEGKRAIIVIASGGVPLGSPVDYCSGYLKHFLGFLGITDVKIVGAERLVADEAAALATAQNQIEALAT